MLASRSKTCDLVSCESQSGAPSHFSFRLCELRVAAALTLAEPGSDTARAIGPQRGRNCSCDKSRMEQVDAEEEIPVSDKSSGDTTILYNDAGNNVLDLRC